MTLRERMISIGAAVVILLAAFVSYELFQEHDARVKAEANQTAQKQIIETNQKTIEQAKTDQQKVASDLEAKLAAIASQRTVIVTPQQAAAVANTLPNLPQQVTVQQVPATPTAPATSQIVIPAADIPAFQKYKLDCDEGNAKLLACEKTGIDLQTQLSATTNQYKAEQLNAESWKATAKGGTFWHRVKHDVIVIGITAGVAYAAGRLKK